MLNKNEFVNAISQARGWSIESHHAGEYSISSQWNESVQLSWKITLHTRVHRTKYTGYECMYIYMRL